MAVTLATLDPSPASAQKSETQQKPIAATLQQPAAPGFKLTVKTEIVPPPPPAPTIHTVQPGESLESISGVYATSWIRLYDANDAVQNPDDISPGQQLMIPKQDDVLPSRPLPVPDPVIEQAVRSVAASAVTGNTYAYGNCTWYVKNMRPDIPNGLGNANTWQSRAAAAGLPVGTEPRVGAVATSAAGKLGHVALVTAVNPDGTIVISEMNYTGFNVVSTRTVAATAFAYIY